MGLKHKDGYVNKSQLNVKILQFPGPEMNFTAITKIPRCIDVYS